MAHDNMPTLASLRRGSRKQLAMPSLFDPPPAPEPAQTLQSALDELLDEHSAAEVSVTAADVLAEQARSLNAPAAATATLHPQRNSFASAPQIADPHSQVPRVWTVADLVREVRSVVERSYGMVTVEGEISNWRPAASGHCYLTLKDGNAQLSAVMFRRQAALMRFTPKDGDAVRLRGQLSVYESRGQMQLIAESLEQVGQGALLAAVQRLKEKLRREGLFDRKRPLPAFPKCIGIVTSLQGAALRDIVKVCRRRHAAVNLLIYPIAVQGPRCAAEVITAVRWFSAHPERADVLLVSRGGGSWEDLHGFDDEGVARAIAACAVPVISGIGHATDSTITDAAADVCAPTPSAAAELVTAAQHRVDERLERLRSRVRRAGRFEQLRAGQSLSRVGVEAALRGLLNALARREQWLDELGFRASAAAARRLRLREDRFLRVVSRLQKAAPAARLARVKRHLEKQQTRLEHAAAARVAKPSEQTTRCELRLASLSPLRVLERGYALVYGPDGKLLRSTANVVSYDTIVARFAQGSLRARVLSKEE